MDDPVAHADNLIDRADALNSRIDERTEKIISGLVFYQGKAKRNQRIMALIIAVLIAVIGVVTLAIVKIRDNASTIQAACEAQNRANANEITLWHFLLDIPPAPNETDAQKEIAIKFTKLVDDTFAPIDCAQPKVLP